MHNSNVSFNYKEFVEWRILMLKFENVSFTYPGQDKAAISDISFEIKKGEFILLCGESGCGKTTLLRHTKKNQIPTGKGSGKMYFDGEDLELLDDKISASQIGYVGQSPDGQIVTDKVWHELAFGLESLGVDREAMHRRIAEMSEYFGISGWYDKKTNELSGGQKQILNLASVMVMHPKFLVLDEPTSQLDPVASERFLQNVKKINSDFGVTVLICEQRIHDVISMADRVMLMKAGQLIGFSDVSTIIRRMKDNSSNVYEALPGYMKLWYEYGEEGNIPVTIRDAKLWIENIKNQIVVDKTLKQGVDKDYESKTETINEAAKKDLSVNNMQKKLLVAKEISFSYGKNNVIKNFSIEISGGKIYAIMGGNGSGKTTALKILAGIYKKKSGKLKKEKDIRVVYLPQNPQTVFTEISVYDELAEVFESHRDFFKAEYEKYSEKNKNSSIDYKSFVDKKIKEVLEKMELSDKSGQHPFDISVGQQQRLAIAKVLLLKPDIMLLDEPTKGLDGEFKRKLADIFKKLSNSGIAVVLVSHDIDFCAENADLCGMLFDGEMTKLQPTDEFFRQNYFYTTDISRMFSDFENKLFDIPVNYEQAVKLFEK